MDANGDDGTVETTVNPSDGAAGIQTDGTEPSDPVTSAIVGESLVLGYPTADGPVVECDRVDVPTGEVTALVGPNGSGKSTLLRGLSGQLEPETGHVLLDGREIDAFGSKELAREVGLLSQENEAPGSLTVEELVYHGRYPHRGFFEPVDDDDDRAVERAIDLAGIDHLRDEAVDELSGGQKQLAWIGMTLAQETDVLLLDEPTTYLDVRHQLRVMETIRRLNAEDGTTVAVVLHDISRAARYAHNLVAIKDGEIYEWGPPRRVVTEALMEEVFGIVASVETDTADGPRIHPHRPLE
jgi:iron complex transport system ATP-binding protein